MRMQLVGNVSAAIAIAVAGVALAATESQLVPPTEVSRTIGVETTRLDGGRIEGRLTNRGSDPVDDVQLLVRDSFHWSNEFRPGTDDPGRAEIVTVPGPIAPGASVPFAVDMGPRPQRRDGRFDTEVEVLGFVERPVR